MHHSKVKQSPFDHSLLLLRGDEAVSLDALDTLDALDLSLGCTDLAIGNIFFNTRSGKMGLSAHDQGGKENRSNIREALDGGRILVGDSPALLFSFLGRAVCLVFSLFVRKGAWCWLIC